MAQAESLKIFVTMTSQKETSMYNWQLEVEELRAALCGSISSENWPLMQPYGPETEGFGLPAVCFEATVTHQELSTLRQYILDNPWISLPVAIYIVQTEF